MNKEYQAPMNKAIVSHLGSSWRDKTEFVMQSELPISEAIAVEEQIRLGFNPRGYGFYGFKCIEVRIGFYQANWYASGSCE